MIDQNKIYAIKRADRKAADELVMNVETDRDGFYGICYLTPPSHGHMIEGEIIAENDNGFTFMPDDQRRAWEFIEVTYENFKQEFYKLAYGGEKMLETIHSTEELEAFYHENFPDFA